MTWFGMMGLVTSIALLLPIITILSFGLAWYKSFPALLAYYILVAGHSFLSLDFVSADKTFRDYYAMFNNLADAPLMLTFMTYFSKTMLFRKRMKVVILAFLLFELIVVITTGFNVNATKVVMAPGLGLVISFAIFFFIHQVKMAVVYQKAFGKAVMTASLLFAYGGYLFIYIVYYLLETPYKADTQLILYLVNVLFAIMFVVGVVLERKRVRQLTELKITREELKVIYGR